MKSINIDDILYKEDYKYIIDFFIKHKLAEKYNVLCEYNHNILSGNMFFNWCNIMTNKYVIFDDNYKCVDDCSCIESYTTTNVFDYFENKSDISVFSLNFDYEQPLEKYCDFAFNIMNYVVPKVEDDCIFILQKSLHNHVEDYMLSVGYKQFELNCYNIFYLTRKSNLLW